MSNTNDKKRYILIDDVSINKQYAKDMEDLARCYGAFEHRPILGQQFVNVMIANQDRAFPISTKMFLTQKVLPGCPKKTDIAYNMIQSVLTKDSSTTILADAHYSTKTFVHLLTQNKFPCVEDAIRDLRSLKSHNLIDYISALVQNSGAYV